MYVLTDSEDHISCVVEDEAYTDSDYIEFDLPEDFDYDHMADYKLIDGVLHHDPSPKSIEEQTAEIKANLAATDYVAIKVLEAQATCEELPKEDQERYAEILKQRKAWRARINELENSVES